LSGCESAPSKPSGLKVTASGGKVEVSWDKNAKARTYRLYRRYTDEKDYKFIFDSKKTSYTDKFVQSGKNYTYKLELIGEGGTSESIESGSVSMSGAPVIESVVQKSKNRFKLSWTGEKNCEFKIYEKSKNSSNKLAETKNFSKTVKVNKNTNSLYVVADSGNASREVNLLRKPKITSITQLDDTTSVLLISSNAKSSYNIYRSKTSGGKYTLIGKTDEPVFYDENAKKGTNWHYKAKAVNKKSSSLRGFSKRTGLNSKPVFGVPIMMYHEFVTKKDLKDGIAFDEYAVYQSEFESDLKWLKKNGYTTITTTQLSDYLSGKGKMPKKPIILSIDDGKHGVYKRAFPILKKYNMKAVLNIIGNEIDLATVTKNYKKNNPAPFSDWNEIKEMSESGNVEIESHTQFLHVFNHDGRNGANTAENETYEQYFPTAQKDYMEIARNMRKHLNTTPVTMAYPYSKRCAAADKAWLKSGYKLLFAGDREDVRMSEINYFVREAGLNQKSSLLRRITRMTGTPIRKYLYE
jgi:peptidoglycan/xylan/chitin deacetylase (PgdA/CDA1 family)/fibronectin type 3 domain-containing protein